jgi:acetyl-CoA carboxylase alpha subunit
MTEPRKKVEKQVYWHEKNSEMTWKDIKHLELEDDDVIHSAWVDDETAEYNGYWHGSIARMVEETDEQYEKRVKRLEEDRERLRQMRYQNYLRLKKEFEDENNAG